MSRPPGSPRARVSRTLAAVAIVGICFAGAAAAIGQAAPTPVLPPGPGRDLVAQACTQCHGLDVVLAQGRTADGWSEVVAQMIGNGAPLDDAQAKAVAAYLAQNFPDHPAGGATPTRPASRKQ